MSEPVISADLRRLTPARVGLGRSGTGLPTAELLQFAADHAIAREAVHATWDVAGARADLAERGWPSRTVATQVSDRALYLRRPDLGRRLAPADRESLAAIAGSADVALVLSDDLKVASSFRKKSCKKPTKVVHEQPPKTPVCWLNLIEPTSLAFVHYPVGSPSPDLARWNAPRARPLF